MKNKKTKTKEINHPEKPIIEEPEEKEIGQEYLDWARDIEWKSDRIGKSVIITGNIRRPKPKE